MRESVAHALLKRKSPVALEARAALRLAELMLDRPWTRRASRWIDLLLVLTEGDA